MASVTIYANKEHSIAETSGSLDVGTSNENHAPIGEGNSGWDWKELIRFPLSGSDFGSITQITSAVLKIRTTDEVHCTNDYGTCRVRGLNGSFAATGGGSSDASDSWKTNADPVWPVSAMGTTGTLGSRTGAWANLTTYEIDVTDYIEKYAPASILKRNGSPCDDATNYGMVLDMNGEAGKSMEFKSMRGSYTPRLVVTGTSTPVPAAPTSLAPSGDLGDPPDESDFSWSGNASDEDPLTAWDFDVFDIDTFTKGINLSSQTTGISGVDVSAPTLTGLAAEMARGYTYWWRVRHKNSEGVYGSWSAYQSFTIAQKPDAPTWVNPTVAKPYALIDNLDEAAVWSDVGDEAKALLSWTYTHPDGLACIGFVVEWDGVEESYIILENIEDGETVTVSAPDKQARGSANAITARIKCTDANGVESDWSDSVDVAVQWSQGVFSYTTGSGAGNFSFEHDAITGGASSAAAFLFRADGAGAWTSDISELEPTSSIQVLVRLSTDDATNNPQLPEMSVSYLGTGNIAPDRWAVSGSGCSIVLDNNKRRFGKRSCRVVTDATNPALVYPTYGGDDPYIIVTPGEEYTFSVFVFASSAEEGDLLIHDGNDVLIDSGAWAHTGSGTWERFSHTFTVPGGTTRIKPIIQTDAGSGSVWLDSAQFEEGGLATQWRPGGIGPAVSIDVGGVQVDSSKGGVFRLLSALGDTSVFMDDSGLTFKDQSSGSEATIGVDSSGNLEVDGTDVSLDGHTHTAGDPVVRVYESSTSWPKPSGLHHIIVEVLGAGGGGGGADNTASTEGASAGGGGAGGYARKLFVASELPSSCTVTVGSGGTGGAGTGADGTDGGDSSFAGSGITTVLGEGGGAGAGDTGGTGNSVQNGGGSGNASGGDVNAGGEPGSNGHRVSMSGVSAATGLAVGRGGASQYGGGGRHPTAGGAYGGSGYGAGGAGAWNHHSGSAQTGADGRDGLVVVTEFY